MYLTASSAAWRYSGKVTGPDSRLSRPSTTSSPLAFFSVPSAAAAPGVAVLFALLEFDEVDGLSSPPHPTTSMPATAAAIHSLVTFTGLSWVDGSCDGAFAEVAGAEEVAPA